MTAPRLDVDRLVDEQRFDGFNVKLLFWCFLALFADGFEISSLGLAAPHLIRDWDVPPGAMGPMMSASLIGIFVGAPLFGYIGDRFGRRPAIIWGCMIFGVTTLAVVAATNITEITILRFLTGVGMGGLMPNAIALTSESSPRRLRARLIILMFMGISLGSSTPGFVAMWAVPTYGWKVIFIIGGVLPLIVGLGLILALPESVKYLVRRQDRRARLISTLRKLRSDIDIPDDARFLLPAQAIEHSTGVRPLFGHGLAPITLLIWLCFATTLMANYFLNSWMPVLFEAKGITPEQSALATTVYHFGGLAGGLLMSVLLDRYGFLIIAALLAIGAPALLAIGVSDLPLPLLIACAACAGFSVLGAQFGGNAAAGLIYPTAIRSQGVGMALAVGRIGSIIGPFVGAWMLSRHLPLSSLLLAIIGPLLLGSLACLGLARMMRGRLGGWQRLGEVRHGTE